MKKIKSYAASSSDSLLKPFDITRRDCSDYDVHINIKYCGVCHSDIHMARNEWGGSTIYPIVPGHEIIGVVHKVGSKVKKLKIGDDVGVGVYVDSCGQCYNCKNNLDHYSEKHTDGTNKFTYSRFLVPYLMDFKGWAIFADGDMVCLSDLSELKQFFDPNIAVNVVKHNYKTKYTIKNT